MRVPPSNLFCNARNGQDRHAAAARAFSRSDGLTAKINMAVAPRPFYFASLEAAGSFLSVLGSRSPCSARVATSNPLTSLIKWVAATTAAVRRAPLLPVCPPPAVFAQRVHGPRTALRQPLPLRVLHLHSVSGWCGRRPSPAGSSPLNIA